MPRHLWTPEAAKAASILASEARTRNATLRKHGITEVAPDPDLYVTRQLARTRKQIDVLNDMLEGGELDPKNLKAIADAKARLYEIEAALANRPKPGQLRPTAQRSAPRPVGGLAPRAAEPAPESQNGTPAPPAT